MNKTAINPTKYVTRHDLILAGINLDAFPNAGPNPSITGMKRIYWGEDAYCLKCGTYVCKVPAHVYFKF